VDAAGDLLGIDQLLHAEALQYRSLLLGRLGGDVHGVGAGMGTEGVQVAGLELLEARGGGGLQPRALQSPVDRALEKQREHAERDVG
jgi:hypothetical protein